VKKVASFGNEFLGATVSYNDDNMHKVDYIREGEIVFSNFIFNDNRESGEKDSIEMAEKFVRQETRHNGK
tara:strand:+ start:105 stop:314 length:210 start_codon:yes stop_codon:yes gene_type:complete